MAKIELPPYGKHLVFLGSTGSGKSYLAERMINEYDRTFVIDTQDSLAVKGKEIRKLSSGMFGLPFQLKIYDRIHYIPAPEYQDKDCWEYLFKTVLDSSSKKQPHPRIVYIDEIFHLGYGHMNFPKWLPKSMTTARQRQLSYWISTQRPRLIPGEILTEASKIYVFYLSKEDDIKFISSFARSDVKALQAALANQQDDYSFIEIDSRKGTWQKFNRIKK